MRVAPGLYSRVVPGARVRPAGRVAGTACLIALFMAADDDALFLQIKEAKASDESQAAARRGGSTAESSRVPGPRHREAPRAGPLQPVRRGASPGYDVTG